MKYGGRDDKNLANNSKQKRILPRYGVYITSIASVVLLIYILDIFSLSHLPTDQPPFQKHTKSVHSIEKTPITPQPQEHLDSTRLKETTSNPATITPVSPLHHGDVTKVSGTNELVHTNKVNSTSRSLPVPDKVIGVFSSDGYYVVYPEIENHKRFDAWGHYSSHGYKETRLMTVKTINGRYFAGLFDNNDLDYFSRNNVHFEGCPSPRCRPWNHYKKFGYLDKNTVKLKSGMSKTSYTSIYEVHDVTDSQQHLLILK